MASHQGGNTMSDARRLDDQGWLRQIDLSDMLGLVEVLPQQCREAQRIARSMPLPRWNGVQHIVVVGMGGSAIGGDFVRALANEQCSVPVSVHRSDTLPRWVGRQCLVVAASYSGNTEETLTAYAEAKRRQARLMAITTGGELAALAANDDCPIVRIPGGLPPRAAIGYSFVSLLVLCERLGLLPAQGEALAEMFEVLEKQRALYGRQSPSSQNPAKALAAALVGYAPVVLGSEGASGVAAYRWKCQFNENSKAPAFWNVFPELTHNETVGWEKADEVLQRLHVVLLRDTRDSERNTCRIDVATQIMGRKAEGITEFWAEGDSSVARLFSLVYPGDFVTTYLALLYGVDPTPIQAIDFLKEELKKR
jgi:glucose/mannose-6-phosphate isomerase